MRDTALLQVALALTPPWSVAKAETGELNLARTIWGLRQAAAPKPCSGSSRPTLS
jgi:hypothetical protein